MFEIGIKMTLVLFFIFILMYGLIFLYRVLMKNEKIEKMIKIASEQQRIIVKSRAKVSPKHMIAIVEIDGKEMAIGLSEANISLLDVPLKEKR